MASSDLRRELDCSICLDIYTDRVILRCGHNFCRVCIDSALDTQEGSGGYSCPECRAECTERPALIRNITLCNIVDRFQITHPHQETDILLDVTTANDYIHISDDRKTASGSDIELTHPVTPERFQYSPQVMSSGGFSSGRHYWEVDVTGSEYWIVGMCYPSIDRTGGQSYIGWNNKSWGLRLGDNEIYMRHDCELIDLPVTTPCDRVRVYLDYEAGQLSFYSLCDPIRHIYTFSTTFTEPLHAVLYVWEGCITISGGSGARSNLLRD